MCEASNASHHHPFCSGKIELAEPDKAEIDHVRLILERAEKLYE